MMFAGGEEYEEEEEDYQYHNWGVDRVDLDFKSGHHHRKDYKQPKYFPVFLAPTFSVIPIYDGDGLQVRTFIIFSLRSPVFVSGEKEGGTVLPAV